MDGKHMDSCPWTSINLPTELTQLLFWNKQQLFRAIHSMERGCLSVENTNGSLLEASLSKIAVFETPTGVFQTRL